MINQGGRPRKKMNVIKLMPDTPYFTVEQVADFTGTHIHTIQARLRDGTLLGKKEGGVWKVFRENFEENTTREDSLAKQEIQKMFDSMTPEEQEQTIEWFKEIILSNRGKIKK